jgi:hypothetical protein
MEAAKNGGTDVGQQLLPEEYAHFELSNKYVPLFSLIY